MHSWRTSFSIQSLTAFGLALLCALTSVPDSLAQQRPLQTQDPAIIAPGNLSLEFGVDFFQNAKYPQSGLQGDLTSVGVIGINVGLGEIVEFQIQGIAHNFLSINQRMAAPITPSLNASGTSTSDYGDLLMSTK